MVMFISTPRLVLTLLDAWVREFADTLTFDS